MSEETDRPRAEPAEADGMAELVRRIHEHKMVQWTIAYVAIAYGIQHAIILTSESFEWPQLVSRITMLLLALGLPIAITVAWYQGARASRNFSQAELSILSVLLLGVSILFYVFVQPADERAPPAATERNIAHAPQGAISLAVLPFLNLSPDENEDYFSDGMTEEITAALAKVPALRVVGRTSAFQFKGKNEDLRAIGQALSATHLIEGSVRKAGDRLRITVQLIKADDGTHIWAEDYDRQLTDVFAVQEDIARAIVASLARPLGLKPGQSLVSSRTITPSSYEDYLRAKAMVRGRGIQRLTDAAALLETVTAHNPNYAPAWALQAQAYELIPVFDASRGNGAYDQYRQVVAASLPKAEAAANRAVALDPDNADGYVALGYAEEFQGHLVAAEDLLKRALTLDPNNPDVLNQYGQFQAAVGRLQDALATRQRLRALEPFVPVYNLITAQVLWLNGRNDEAITLLGGSTEERFATVKGMIYASMGRYGDAADALQNMAVRTYSKPLVQDAVQLLHAAPTDHKSTRLPGDLGMLGYVYLYVGAPERALENFEGIAAVNGYTSGIYAAVAWHRSYAALRKTERFKALVRKAGMVDYWKERGWPSFCHPTTGDDFECS